MSDRDAEPDADRPTSSHDPSDTTSAAGHRDGVPLLGPDPRLMPRDELAVSAPEAAVRLLGGLLVRRWADGERTVARIVETEAYREDDPASHSAAGPTARTRPMFEGPGIAYVYRSYGIHWCVNVSVEPPSVGAAVLLRAAVVLAGVGYVRDRRPTSRADTDLLRGPGNLAAGLDIDAPRYDGCDLIADERDLQLVDDGWTPPAWRVVTGPRVGVTRAAEVPWRFRVAGVRAVSAYRRSPRAPARS